MYISFPNTTCKSKLTRILVLCQYIEGVPRINKVIPGTPCDFAHTDTSEMRAAEIFPSIINKEGVCS
jgi:hypothetical protein